MKILLIRHGKTKGNTEGRYVGRTDEPLLEGEENGIKAVTDFMPDMVYASPMIRCVQTAELLFPDWTGKTVRWNGLEETDFGEFEYRNYKELNGDPRYQAWIDGGGVGSFPGAEDTQAFRARCRNAFLEVCQDAKAKGYEQIAVVVHGGTIMSVMEAYAQPKRSFYDWQPKNGCGFYVSWDTEDTLVLNYEMDFQHQ